MGNSVKMYIKLKYQLISGGGQYDDKGNKTGMWVE